MEGDCSCEADVRRGCCICVPEGTVLSVLFYTLQPQLPNLLQKKMSSFVQISTYKGTFVII